MGNSHFHYLKFGDFTTLVSRVPSAKILAKICVLQHNYAVSFFLPTIFLFFGVLVYDHLVHIRIPITIQDRY